MAGRLRPAGGGCGKGMCPLPREARKLCTILFENDNDFIIFIVTMMTVTIKNC